MKRVADAEKARRRRDAAGASFLNTGQLGSACLRYIKAGEIAGAWNNFGWLGAMRANLARPRDLPVIRNMETASRLERAQGAAGEHVARGGGSLQLIKEEHVEVNRGRHQHCVTDQLTGFTDRKKPEEAPAGRSAYCRRYPRKTPQEPKQPR